METKKQAKAIYISLPISGREDTYEERLKQAVDYCKENYKDWDVITPKEISEKLDEAALQDAMLSGKDPNLKYEDYLLTDLHVIINSADVVLMCEGWEESRGCQIEKFVAEKFGKKIHYLIPNKGVFKGAKFGDLYVTRGGELKSFLRILQNDGDYTYPVILVSVGGSITHYMLDGKFIKDKEHQFDIVKKYNPNSDNAE